MKKIPTVPAVDMVNHPPHYTQGEIECIDAIAAALGEDGFKAYCRGCVIKYAWRTGLKDDATTDLKKMRWYAGRAVGKERESCFDAPPRNGFRTTTRSRL